MSNKNLKVYKMLFITELRQMTMSVKFACKIRVTWKRSTLQCIQATNLRRAAGWLSREEWLASTRP